jgi:hypothetical protein
MTDENRPTEGAPAPKQNESPKKSPAVSHQDAPPLIAPLVTPFPSLPSYPGPATDIDWGADDGIELTEADLEGAVGHKETRILRRVNAKLPSAWIQGPGGVELLVEGEKLLKGAARAAGKPMSEIEAVVVKAVPLHQMVLLAPAVLGAPGAIETRQEGHGALLFTISDILREAKMQVTSGYRELYPVKKVTKSPIGPAIGISMAKPLETRKVERKKKS